MRGLHITNWYPSQANPRDALFIREQISALRRFADCIAAHVQVVSDRPGWRIRSGTYDDGTHYCLAESPWPQGRGVELLTALLLIYARFRLGRRTWQITNVHIAYPLFRFPTLFRLLFGREIAVTEHWSAYRKGFNLPVGSPARQRIAGMFSENLPIAVVSRALAEDIRAFSGLERLNYRLVPNVVDPSIFHPTEPDTQRLPSTFLMVANWAPVKKPFLVLEAIERLLSRFPSLKLRIVGEGAQSEAMRAFVRDRGLAEVVTFLGPRSKPEIAAEMRQVTAFLHPSEYETFSVVCAEAVSCGCPVIASNVGGIPEVVGDSGWLVENTTDAWTEAIDRFLRDGDGVRVTGNQRRFTPEQVGQVYLSFLQDVIASARRAS